MVKRILKEKTTQVDGIGRIVGLLRGMRGNKEELGEKDLRKWMGLAG